MAEYFFNEIAGITIIVLIFGLTLLLAIKRWISPAMTFVLLLFCLLVGVTIANQNLIHYYLSNEAGRNNADLELEMAQFQEKMIKNYESLKSELELQKRKLQILEEKQAEQQKAALDSQ